MKKKIELFCVPGAMMETTPRFKMMFNGENVGQLYFNMRGYIAERGIPVPSETSPKGYAMLQIGERPLSVFKQKIAAANREWAEIPA